MRTRFAISLMVVLTLASAAIAEDTAGVKKQIQAGLKASMAALGKKDVKGFLRFYSDDYEGTQQGMKVNRAALEQVMKGYVADTKQIHSATYDVENLKVKGNKAAGNSTLRLDETVIDSQGFMGGAKGQSHRMKLEQHNATTYSRVGGAWKVSRNDVRDTRMWIDGKLFNPMAPPPGK